MYAPFRVIHRSAFEEPAMAYLHSLPTVIESSLEEHLPQCRHFSASPLDRALRSAVFPGGKRLRPMLTMLGARIFSADIQRVLPAACAVEFIHTSSLIFDDLPCMDDAKLRRGAPALHRVYGEGIALLAGIALLNQAYAICGETPELIREATACVGVNGMIGGQALDLSPVPAGEFSSDHISRLADRDRKTSAMMRLALSAGALAHGVTREELLPLSAAGIFLGEAYQICDDLLDVKRSSKFTGKIGGQDHRHSRPTHETVNAKACFRRIHDLLDKARASIEKAYGLNSATDLMDFVATIFTDMTREAGTVASPMGAAA